MLQRAPKVVFLVESARNRIKYFWGHIDHLSSLRFRITSHRQVPFPRQHWLEPPRTIRLPLPRLRPSLPRQHLARPAGTLCQVSPLPSSRSLEVEHHPLRPPLHHLPRRRLRRQIRPLRVLPSQLLELPPRQGAVRPLPARRTQPHCDPRPSQQPNELRWPRGRAAGSCQCR
jgi:hypothetical protein